MAIIDIPITYIDGVDVVHGQDITDTQETAIDAREKALRSIVNVQLNDTTGVFTFTRGNGTTFTLDTLLEKVVTNFTYDSTTQELVLTLEDGTTQRIPMSAFIDDYSGVDGDMITVSVSSGNAISAVLKDGTITKAKLISSVQASLNKADTSVQKTDPYLKNATVSNDVLTITKQDDTTITFQGGGGTPYVLPQATSTTLGGVKASTKTSADTQEVHIDTATGKLYTQAGGTSVIMRRWKTTLDDLSWSEIETMASNGTLASKFPVGSKKTITLSNDEEVTLVVMGYNHDDLTGGGKAGVTFGMENLLSSYYSMNASSTNTGGWNSSAMRTSTMATLLSLLPSDLQSVIKFVDKKASAGNTSTTITTSSDKLWLFSEVEIDGTTATVYKNEGAQYEYWQTVKNGTVASDRIKYLPDETEAAWWLRSPYVGMTSRFRDISASGGIGDYNANISLGVCFGFCI